MKYTGFLSLACVLVLSFTQYASGVDIVVRSNAFKNGQRIPRAHTCDGADISPALAWSFVGSARSFAVTCTDPDAPVGVFIHWIAYNIPAHAKGLDEGFARNAPPFKTLQGNNDFGRAGYNGPCPPKGKPHRYYFTVYALDIAVNETGLSYQGLMARIKGHVLAQGQLMGLYGR